MIRRTLRLPVLLVSMLLAWMLLLSACGDEPLARSQKSFNAHVLDVVATYPTDGTHGYWWPKTGPWIGNARTITYLGDVFEKGDEQGRCYCCGLTFEVFLQAWARWAKETGAPPGIPGIDRPGLRKFQREWFGSPSDRSCFHTAIVGAGIGKRILRFEDAQPGDFVQFWRHNGTGHSVVFLGWVGSGDHITGINYWSSQGSTKGIAKNTEAFGERGATLKRDEIWIVRVEPAAPP